MDGHAPRMHKEQILDPASLGRDGLRKFCSLILHQDHFLHRAGSIQSHFSSVANPSLLIYSYLKSRSSPKYGPGTAEGLLLCFMLKGRPPGSELQHGEGEDRRGSLSLTSFSTAFYRFIILNVANTQY